MEKVIVIAGPTAVGKTRLSTVLAEKYNGEIVNADASQLRRRLDIGTAKTAWQNQTVKHHLFDIIAPTDPFSISDYQKSARNIIEDIMSRGKIPFLVGGSGLYINAALNDYDLSIPGRNPLFDERHRPFSNEELYEMLVATDPVSSEKIHMNNRRRVLRALEAAGHGLPQSRNIRGRRSLYENLIICLALERSLLYDRINERVQEMFNAGFIEEVALLIKDGYNPDDIKEIGYKEVGMHLKGVISLYQVKELIKMKTRRYAKKQNTWFRNQTDSVFLAADPVNFPKTVGEAEAIIDVFLK